MAFWTEIRVGHPSVLIKTLQGNVADMIVIIVGPNHVGFQQLIIGWVDHNRFAVPKDENLV